MKDKVKPVRRNVQHLLAKMKSGAGGHTDKRPIEGPSEDEWTTEDTTEEE